MATFRCERYPQLGVTDPDNAPSRLAQFREGIFETDDPRAIRILENTDAVERVDAAPAAQASDDAVLTESPEQGRTPAPVHEAADDEATPESREAVLRQLIDNGIELGVVSRRYDDERLYWGRYKVGEDIDDAVSNLLDNEERAVAIAEEVEEAA